MELKNDCYKAKIPNRLRSAKVLCSKAAETIFSKFFFQYAVVKTHVHVAFFSKVLSSSNDFLLKFIFEAKVKRKFFWVFAGFPRVSAEFRPFCADFNGFCISFCIVSEFRRFCVQIFLDATLFEGLLNFSKSKEKSS